MCFKSRCACWCLLWGMMMNFSLKTSLQPSPCSVSQPTHLQCFASNSSAVSCNQLICSILQPTHLLQCRHIMCSRSLIIFRRRGFDALWSQGPRFEVYHHVHREGGSCLRGGSYRGSVQSDTAHTKVFQRSYGWHYLPGSTPWLQHSRNRTGQCKSHPCCWYTD